METKIAIISNNQFKSKSLNTATAGLAKAFQNIENGRKDACAILAKVERNKSYKEDGFNSLAEYAETIGLEKSLAHKMENAGRLLISENPEMKAFADKTDFSKLAILSSADENVVLKAVQDGKLTPDSTQADVKEWKAENRIASGKDKVLSKYEIDFTIFTAKGTRAIHYDSIEFENVPEFDDVAWGNITAPDGKIKVGVYPDGSLVKIEFMDKVKKTAKVKSAKDMTFEDLKKLAASLGYELK